MVHDLVAHHLASGSVRGAVIAALATTVALLLPEAEPAIVRYARTQLSEQFRRAGSTAEALDRLRPLSSPDDTLTQWAMWRGPAVPRAAGAVATPRCRFQDSAAPERCAETV